MTQSPQPVTPVMPALDAPAKAPRQRLLCIAYYYPPAGGAGVQRPLKFTQYLAEFGWQPRVLTVSDGCFFARDESLLHEIPNDCVVTRTWSIEFERLTGLRNYRRGQSAPPTQRRPLADWGRCTVTKLLSGARRQMLPDPQIGWVPFALAAALRICRTEGIDAVWTTSAPYSCHLIGLLLKQAVGLPWVADFRDAWSDNPMGPLPHYKAHRWLEQRVLEGADRVVAVTPEITRDLQARTHGPAGKYHVIANGYDAKDMAPFAARRPTAGARAADAPFILTMTGSVYGKMSAVYFYEALAAFFASFPLARRYTQVRWVGQMDRQARLDAEATCTRLGLQEHVTHVGYVSHAQAIEALHQADVLLLILFSGQGAGQVMTGKIFEYLSSKKPILAMAKNSAAAELVTRCQAGIVTEPEDVSAIAQALAQLWQRRSTPWPQTPGRQAVLAPYSRHALTHKLAKLLDELTVPATRSGC